MRDGRPVGDLLHRAFSGAPFEKESRGRVHEVDAVITGARNDAAFLRGADVGTVYAFRIAAAL
jgi:hypothetical protein